MSEELIITKEDLVNWLDRPLSNDDLDLIIFITARLENFYKLEEENKQLKERLEYEQNLNEKTLYKLTRYEDRIKELQQENKQLKKVKKILLCGFDTQATIFKALEILGEKENE